MTPILQDRAERRLRSYMAGRNPRIQTIFLPRLWVILLPVKEGRLTPTGVEMALPNTG